MSDDLVFGDVQMTQPEKALRPDRNRHYAVVAIGKPKAHELPIYVDLDVMRDMDEHALSDTSVELGGVLLGGQHHDADGEPFVVITDSLRAQHYESTKGSFKFTHETWSAITQQRDEFPPECQMVGWYHTHPDWGVFLSGMDLFICNNFFNKPLDVAYVIDPCRQDRGMFQWTGGAKPSTHRTSAFYLIASRFRQAELEEYVAALMGEIPMPGPHDRGATVVNLHGQQPPWMGPAVLGMLSLQFCLLALIAWKMISPPAVDVNQQVTQLLAEKTKTQNQVLDKVLAELKGAPEGYTSSLQAEMEQKKRLQRDLVDRQELADARANERDGLLDDLQRVKAEGLATKARLEKELASAQASRDKLKEKLTATEAEVKQAATAAAGKESSGTTPRMAWILGGGIAFLALVAAGAAALNWRGNAGIAEEEESTARGSMAAPSATKPSSSPADTDAAMDSIPGSEEPSPKASHAGRDE